MGIYGDGDGSVILGVIEWFFDPQPDGYGPGPTTRTKRARRLAILGPETGNFRANQLEPWPHPARGWDTTIVMLYISVLVKCLLKPRKILSQKNASA